VIKAEWDQNEFGPFDEGSGLPLSTFRRLSCMNSERTFPRIPWDRFVEMPMTGHCQMRRSYLLITEQFARDFQYQIWQRYRPKGVKERRLEMDQCTVRALELNAEIGWHDEGITYHRSLSTSPLKRELTYPHI
jgi:hypothetical protein